MPLVMAWWQAAMSWPGSCLSLLRQGAQPVVAPRAGGVAGVGGVGGRDDGGAFLRRRGEPARLQESPGSWQA